MKLIKLTRDCSTKVDDSDYDLLSQTRWYTHIPQGRNKYAVTKPYSGIVWMHRFILGAQPGEFVDHINGDSLDNQRHNLRICTHQQNMSNQKKRLNSSSRYKGVSKIKPTGKWASHIKVNYKKIHLGNFVLESDAALEYNKAALKYFGEFARLNEVKK